MNFITIEDTFGDKVTVSNYNSNIVTVTTQQ